MAGGLSDVRLNSVCKHFTEKFCICVQQGDNDFPFNFVYFFNCICIQFGYQSNTDFYKKLVMSPSCLFHGIVGGALESAAL